MLRFTPNLTGDLNINDLRIALLNYIVSRQRNEDFIIRIEDIHPSKYIENQDAQISALFELFGIKIKDVLYQSKNIRFYQTMAFDLLSRKKAFNCFCSCSAEEKCDCNCEDLPAIEVIDNPNPFSVRMKQPSSPILFQELKEKNISFSADEIGKFMILQIDKTPTKLFANAIDDMLQDISFVIQNETFFQNTPKEIYIRNELGYTKAIQYIHIPLIKKADYTIKSLLEEGYLPEAISNYLISIGYEAPQEIFTLDEAIQWFDITKLSDQIETFNIALLKDYNKKHLLQLDDKELSRYVGFADSEIGKLAKLFIESENISTTKALKEKIKFIFAPKHLPKELEENGKMLKEIIIKAPYIQTYEEFINYLHQNSKLKESDLLISLRYLLTGMHEGPNLEYIYKYLKNYIMEVIK